MLDELCVCFLNKDLEQFHELISLPLTLVANPGHVILRDLHALSVTFMNHLDFMDMHKVDMICRSPIALEECEDGVLLGTYNNEVLSGGRRVIEPYQSTALLRHSESRWKITSILNTSSARVTKRFMQTRPLPLPASDRLSLNAPSERVLLEGVVL